MNKDATTFGWGLAKIQARKRAWERKHKPAHEGIERRRDVQAADISADPEPLTGQSRDILKKMLHQTKRQYKGLTAPEISTAKEKIERFKRGGSEEDAREILKFALIIPRGGIARAKLEVMKRTKVPMNKALKPPTPREHIGMPPRGLAKETDPVKRLETLFGDK